MNLIKKTLDYFKKSSFNSNLIKLILILLVILLLKLTDNVWMSIIKKLIQIFSPFVVGFLIAFIIRPIVIKYEKKNVSRKFTVFIIFFLVFSIVIIILLNLIPSIYSRLYGFINSLITGVNWLYDFYLNSIDNPPNIILDSFIQELIVILNDTKTWLPNITIMIPQIFSYLVKFITNSIFAIVIGIYMSLTWEKIAGVIEDIASKISEKLPKYLYVASYAFSEYVRGLFILMIIKFIEYSILYYLIGSKDWSIIALLTALGLVIPYFGATIANVVGILTALTLPTINIFILIVGIVVLSFVDAYIIAPIVHSKNSKVEPLWTLFCVFAGGVLLGPLGIMISIPLFMSIRVILKVYKEEKRKLTN